MLSVISEEQVEVENDRTGVCLIVIRNFRKKLRKATVGQCVSTREFTIGGSLFTIELYLAGDECSGGDHISLFLTNHSEWMVQAHTEVSVNDFLLLSDDPAGEIFQSKEAASPERSLGWSQCIPHSRCYNNDFLSQDGMLTLKVVVTLLAEGETVSPDQISDVEKVTNRIAAIERAYQNKLAALEQTHQDNLAALQQNHQANLSALQQTYQDNLSALQKATQEQLAEKELDFREQLGAMELVIREQLVVKEREIQKQLVVKEQDIKEQLSAAERFSMDKLAELELKLTTQNTEVDRVKSRLLDVESELQKVQQDDPVPGTAQNQEPQSKQLVSLIYILFLILI